MDFHSGQIAEDNEVQVQIENPKKTIFSLVMEGKWADVVQTCRERPSILGEKITSTEETILHLAVADDQPMLLKQLVEMVTDGKFLASANEKGNTPLHQAAAMGNTAMAKCFVDKDKELIKIRNNDKETPLIKIRNNDKETPLFVAAQCGKKDTFLYLQSECPPNEGIEHWRGREGNSVLHVAISGEYFDLAFQILKKCNDQRTRLVNFRNERGQLPLHVLASNPSAFRSGSHFNIIERIFYRCIMVKDVEESFYEEKQLDISPGKYDKLPENYRVWTDAFDVMKMLIKSTTCPKLQGGSSEGERRRQEDPPFPSIYETFYNGLELVLVLMEIYGVGFISIQELKEIKQKHTWASEIMVELVEQASMWEYEAGAVPSPDLQHSSKEDKEFFSPPKEIPRVDDDKQEEDAGQNRRKEQQEEKDKKAGGGKKESPMLVAAKVGVKEMVEKILQVYPVAIRDANQDGKNVVLLAVENRQPFVYKFLLENKFPSRDSAFQKVDNNGNSALHLAATLTHHKPWLIPGEALQMQWEIKWYKFVQESMPRHFFTRLNNKGQTAKEVFTETHKGLVENGGKWLTSTAESCSVVAALIATVAFATATTVPGGVKEDTGAPTLEGKPAFEIFAITSLIALCFSVTSLTMFLAILTSRSQESDFRVSLPTKLIFGLTSLFVSIAAILISFCAGHFFVLKEKLKIAAFPVYAITCLPITFFAVAQFPLYVDLLRSFIAKLPQRTYEATSL